MARIKNLFVFFLLKSKYENRHPLKELKKKRESTHQTSCPVSQLTRRTDDVVTCIKNINTDYNHLVNQKCP